MPRLPRASLPLLMALLGACTRTATQTSPESGAQPAAASDPSPEDIPGDDASPADPIAVIDSRPRALTRLVPLDDLDAGNAAPTGLVPDCEAQLTQAGVTFRAARLPVHREHAGKSECGAPQVVTYVRGPGSIAYDPPPLLTCAMALAMASFERILQDEADRTCHSPVARIEQIGTYSCREIVAVKGLPSEHSYANAIDLTRFTLKNGTAITVLRDFDQGERPPSVPAGAFLRAISERAHDEYVFSNVLTPFWDPAHKNHFHLDLARYRVNGVRPHAR